MTKKSSMWVLMFKWINAWRVFSNSFQVNMFMFNNYRERVDTQTGKSFGIKISKHKGSGGVKAENSPLAITLLFFIRFLNCFRFLVWSKEYNFKIMVRSGIFFLLPIKVLRAWILEELFKSWKSYLGLLTERRTY